MSAVIQLDPLTLLQDIESRAHRAAVGLPHREEVRAVWSGIGFRLGPVRLVAPLEEVKEVLTYPAMSRVPGTKPWVKGIANVRGNLLPVMDLKGFLGAEASEVGPRSRILVVNHDGVFAGLLVDDVFGLRHFLVDEGSPSTASQLEAMRPFVKGGFDDEDRHWGVFSLHALAENPLFLQVAM